MRFEQAKLRGGKKKQQFSKLELISIPKVVPNNNKPSNLQANHKVPTTKLHNKLKNKRHYIINS